MPIIETVVCTESEDAFTDFYFDEKSDILYLFVLPNTQSVIQQVTFNRDKFIQKLINNAKEFEHQQIDKEGK